MSAARAALKAAKSALDGQAYGEAAEQARIALNTDPKNYHGHVFLGLALEKSGQTDDALKSYISATKIKPHEELAWKGLCNLYAALKSNGVEGFVSSSLGLGQACAEHNDIEGCQNAVDRLIPFAKEFGSRAEYKNALSALLPTSPIYDFLEGRIPRPAYTYITLAEITEAEDRELMNKEIGERRTRLGAKLDQVTASVTRDVLGKSNRAELYQNVVEWTTDDSTRRLYEEKLLQLVYDFLIVLPHDAQSEKRKEVIKLAHDMIIIKHPFILAWTIELEWADFDDISTLDRGVLLEFINHFPNLGLSKVLSAYLNYVIPDIKAGSLEANESDVIESMDPEERLLLLSDGLDEAKSSALANRLAAAFYLQLEEYEICANVSRHGLALLQKETTKSGLSMADNSNALESSLATSLVYHQSPKNHPEARALFDHVLKRKPKSTAALLGIGLIYEEDQNYEKAVEFLSRASSENPEDIRIRAEYAWCHALQGNLQQGLEELEICLEDLEQLRTHQTELKAQILFRIGRCTWELKPSKIDRKSRKGAYSYFIAAIKTDINHAAAYTYLGLFYMDYAKDKLRARQCFQKAFELSGQEVLSAERLARLFAKDDDWDVVELVARRVIDSGLARSSPGSKRKGLSWPFTALAIVQMHRQEYPKSVVSFQSALRVKSGEFYSWAGLGESYHSSGRYNSAKRTIEHALEIPTIGSENAGHDKWYAQYMLANVYRELGEFDEAIEHYQKILSTHPGEPGVSFALIQALSEYTWQHIEAGSYGLAGKCIIDAIKLAQQNVETHEYSFNYWKAIGDLCAAYSWISKHLHSFPCEDIRSILHHNQNHSNCYKILQSSDKIDLNLLDTEYPSSEQNLLSVLLPAILSYKRAIDVASQDVHAQAVAWYNLGCIEDRAARCSIVRHGKRDTLSFDRFTKTAARCFKKAIELEAGNSEFWNALGVVTAILDPTISQHSFVRSLHLNERSARTWTNLGALYLLQNDQELAHRAFGRAQSTDPDYAYAWLGEGFIALLIKDNTEALAHFTHAAQIANASVVDVKARYATSMFDQLISSNARTSEIGHVVEPMLALQQLHCLSPGNLAFQHLLALLKERVCDTEGALNLLEKVRTHYESQYEVSESAEELGRFAQATSDLARNQLATGDYTSAVSNAETALTLCEATETEDSGLNTESRECVRLSAHLTAGLAHYFMGALEQSVDMFRNALDDTGASAEVVCLLAQLLWARGGSDEKSVATDQLWDIVAQHPNHIGATILLGAIAALDDDSSTMDAALESINGLRATSRLSFTDRNQIESFLSKIACLTEASADPQNGGKEKSSVEMNISLQDQAITSIMLTPWQSTGWTSLSSITGQSEIAEIAMGTAMQMSPPNGLLGSEDLASIMAQSGTAADIQRSIVLCPWNRGGWVALENIVF